MPKEKIIWKHKAAWLYYKEISQKASGVIDEKYLKEYIAAKKNVRVISLGIGGGRELYWLKKFKNIKGITGVDYSERMLDICREVAKKLKVKITLIKDNLLSLKKFERFIKKEKVPLIYICLLNTLGNFTQKQRERISKNIRDLMKEKDRLILCLYKRPERIKTKISLPSQVKVKDNSGREIKIKEAIEYASLEFLWPPILQKYFQLPRFWYDDNTNNITIYIDGEKILISHRFSREEIKNLAKAAKLKIEKIIEGKFMWIVILKA